jgi:membrane-associated phospholipid phosphatase
MESHLKNMTFLPLAQETFVRRFCEWRDFLLVPYNFANIILSLALLEIAYWITKISAVIATKQASSPVSDIVFTYFPRIDTSFIHGTLSFLLYDLRLPLFIILIRYVPFGAKALALLILFRAAVINFTHLGMPDGIVPIVSSMTFGGDLFFSGHVANTFMLALVFWDKKWLRYFLIGMSVLFGVAAVLGHYHYTIDVIAAPFFAYGIFTIAKKLFPEDYQHIVHK